ncbi:MAG: hypothetical protein QM811_19390 [Pirellulales bacterium]
MPNLAAFPKAYMDALCVDGSMSLREWVELAKKLPVEGLEFYSGFLETARSGLVAVARAYGRRRRAGDSDALLFAGLHASGPGVPSGRDR